MSNIYRPKTLKGDKLFVFRDMDGGVYMINVNNLSLL